MTAHLRATVSSRLLPLLLLAGSGFSALVYQVLWLRLLGLVFGVTVQAASTVLAAFMAGLALGSFLGGRAADRARSPLRWFGAAEILIGMTALATPLLFSGLDGVYRGVHQSVSTDIAVLTTARFVGSFVVLLIPTTLMGATMPLVLRASVRQMPELGTRAAALYAANTAGALTGALLTGYYLVALVGISGAFRIAATVNVLVGITALLWRTTAAPGAPDNSAAAPNLVPSLGGVPPSVLLVVFTISGFAGLALEIVWFRTLVLFLPATTYVFTTILAVVLGGIAIGSLLARRSLRHGRDWISVLALLQVAIAIAAVGSMAAQGWTYARGWRTGAALQASALSILPTMLLMGAAFPIGLFCWTAAARDAEAHAGERVGRFYLLNLIGAILGAVTAGFLLIPTIGTRASLVVISALTLATGLALLAFVARRRPAFAWGGGVASILLFVTVAALVRDPLDAVIERRYGGAPLLWREEGAQSTVSVHQSEHRTMYLDGLHQANDSPEMLDLHRRIGALAMTLNPSAQDALVIGLGGGATAGAVAAFSNASVEIVELSPAVVRAAEWFRHANGDVLRRPNVTVRIEDGRNYLRLTPKRYDVITADIIQPFHAGAGSLYSIEYFRLAGEALDEDGLLLQWIGHRPETQYKLIARTFIEAFPETTVWGGGTLLVGKRRPLRLSRATYEQRFADPAFVEAAAPLGLRSFEDLLAFYTAGGDQLRAFVGAGPVLTDDRPLVEYFMSLPRGDRDVALDGLTGDVRRHVVN